MAIRDRYTIRLLDGRPDLEIVATRSGGAVEYSPPGRGSPFYVFNELSAADVPLVIRTLEINPASILAIIKDQAPIQKTRVRVKGGTTS